MQIKITIEDIEKNELRTYGQLGKVLAHLLGGTATSVTPSMEGEESTAVVTPQPSQPNVEKLPCAWCSRGFKTPLQLNRHLSFCSKNPNNESETNESRACSKCEATETPQWRRMAEHDGILCNACAMRIRRERTKPNARQSNPFLSKKEETKPKRRVVRVVKPVKRPVYTKMDTKELKDAVASYVAGNNGVILEANTLASALMTSIEKRYDFPSEKIKEHSLSVLESSIGLQFRYLEDALKGKGLSGVTYVLDSKRHTMLILNTAGSFDVDDIREMLNQ